MRRLLLIWWIVAPLVVSLAAETSTRYRFTNADVYMGRETGYDAVADFYFDANDFALKIRKLILSDVGDPGDLGCRRSGPDNAPFDAKPERLEPGYPICSMYSQANNGNGFKARNTQMTHRAIGYQSESTAGGQIELYTTPVGEADLRLRVVIEPDGTLNLAGVPTTYVNGQARLRIRTADGQIRALVLP